MTLLQLWDRMLSFHAWRTSSQGSAQVNTRPHFSRRPELWTNTGHENMLHASPNILISQGTLLPHPPKSKTKRNLHHQSSEFVASPHVKGRDSSLHSVLDESRSLWNGDKRRTRPKTTNRIPSGLRGWERRTRDMEFVVMTTVTKANQAGVPIL